MPAMRPLLASLLLAFEGAAAAASPFGTPLSCAPGMVESVARVADKTTGFAVSEDDGTWVVASMQRIGYPAPLPETGPARVAALRAATLLRKGNVVAAKMANDEAIANVPGYKAKPFAASLEALLTVVTQPVMHASYPTSVRADGEVWPANVDHSHTHGVDMERASASLVEIINRAEVSRRAVGAAYDKPAVRFYLLANGFGDDIALRAAGAAVCAAKLDKATLKKLDVSSRFMAMPSAVKN